MPARPGFPASGEAVSYVISADDREAHNGFATPHAIRPRREVLRAGGTFSVSLPRHSVSVIVLRVGS